MTIVDILVVERAKRGKDTTLSIPKKDRIERRITILDERMLWCYIHYVKKSSLSFIIKPF